ncbi:hypothetical protein HanXRQr2_Chr09g0377251 [Helianthus annuus]|uniref:Uncharacterized protein n=1 Tax=Helianthus annuus TaxID=4232 RepID=A0A251TSQ3_HELAN|nr:hypothetical protein HanXRQr2_Chr09g0377251 [Helianthus annuus]
MGWTGMCVELGLTQHQLGQPGWSARENRLGLELGLFPTHMNGPKGMVRVVSGLDILDVKLHWVTSCYKHTLVWVGPHGEHYTYLGPCHIPISTCLTGRPGGGLP